MTRLIVIISQVKSRLLDWGFSGPYKEGPPLSKKGEEFSWQKKIPSSPKSAAKSASKNSWSRQNTSGSILKNEMPQVSV
jgi:hypothetical protein